MEKQSGNGTNARKRARETEERSDHNRIEISGDNGKREPPVPIPNTEVKPLSADGTWLETARESRSSPDSKDIGKETYRYRYSSVAQWQSIRLLTEGL